MTPCMMAEHAQCVSCAYVCACKHGSSFTVCMQDGLYVGGCGFFTWEDELPADQRKLLTDALAAAAAVAAARARKPHLAML